MKYSANIDMASPKKVNFHVVQDDALTRSASLRLFLEGEQYSPAEELGEITSAGINYVKSDGTRGSFDELPDGADAVTINGNEVNITFAPQMLTAQGVTIYNVWFRYEDPHNIKKISTFPLYLTVHPSAVPEGVPSTDYWNLHTLADIQAEVKSLEDAVEAIDLSDYATKVELNEVKTSIDDKATKDELQTLGEKVEELAEKIPPVYVTLSYYDGDYYSSMSAGDIYNAIQAGAEIVLVDDGVYYNCKKSEVNTAIFGGITPEMKAVLYTINRSIATKTELNLSDLEQTVTVLGLDVAALKTPLDATLSGTVNTDGTVTNARLDKTFSALHDAFVQGREVHVVYQGYYLAPYRVTSSLMEFNLTQMENPYNQDDGGIVANCSISSSGQVSAKVFIL